MCTIEQIELTLINKVTSLKQHNISTFLKVILSIHVQSVVSDVSNSLLFVLEGSSKTSFQNKKLFCEEEQQILCILPKKMEGYKTNPSRRIEWSTSGSQQSLASEPMCVSQILNQNLKWIWLMHSSCVSQLQVVQNLK